MMRGIAERLSACHQEARAYPTGSRPLDGSARYIIDWNEGPGMSPTFAANPDHREIRADARLDRLYAAPGEALTATVRVVRDDDGVPVVSDELTASVEWYRPDGGWERAAQLPFARARDAHVVRFVPSGIAALAAHPRKARLLVQVRLGESLQHLALRFLYAAEAPLVVHGVSGERWREGTLEVCLDFDFRYAAPTLVQAALFDVAGEHVIAICDDYFRPSKAGRQQVAIPFFGKLLRERGLDGPYRLRALHGYVRVPHLSPPEVFWSYPDDPPILTRRYRACDLSDAGWSGPEKKGKAALVLRVIEEQEGQP